MCNLKLLFTNAYCPGFSTYPDFSTIPGHKSCIEYMSGNEICVRVTVKNNKSNGSKVNCILNLYYLICQRKMKMITFQLIHIEIWIIKVKKKVKIV